VNKKKIYDSNMTVSYKPVPFKLVRLVSSHQIFSCHFFLKFSAPKKPGLPLESSSMIIFEQTFRGKSS